MLQRAQVMHQRSLALDGFPQRLADNRQELRIVHGFLKKSFSPGFEGALPVCGPG